MLCAILSALVVVSPSAVFAQACDLTAECPTYPPAGLCSAEAACGDAFWACIDACDTDASCCRCGWRAVSCATSRFAAGSGCYLDLYSSFCGGAGSGGFEGSGIPGSSQSNPVMPDAVLPAGGVMILRFYNLVLGSSGAWFDPPASSAVSFEMKSNARFTAILDFPTGFAQPFAVSTDEQQLGTHGPGDWVDFSGFPGGGVTSFRVSGIAPAISSSDPLAFPIRLAFSPEQASFDMVLPEPTGAGTCATAALTILAGLRGRRDGRWAWSRGAAS